jgi:hypothetical protein
MSKLLVQLVSPSGGSFAGHTVSASFTQKVQQEGATTAPVEIHSVSSAVADVSGKAEIALPAKSQLTQSPIGLKVSAPDGQALGEGTAQFADVDSGKPVKATVSPKEGQPLGESADPSFGKPARVRGLIIDRTGGNGGALRQVVLRATRDGGGEEIVGTAVSDEKGYFSVPYPLGQFERAEGEPAGAEPLPIAINADGSFPERVVLSVTAPGPITDAGVPRDPDPEDLVNAPDTYTDDIGGRCTDFTKPNRVLEEFSFYTVVRTTEPAIRGLTVGEPRKFRVEDLLAVIDPKILPLAAARSEFHAATGAETAVSHAFDTADTPLLRRTAVRTFEIADRSPLEALQTPKLLDTTLELHNLADAVSLTALREANAKPASGGPTPLANVRLDAEIVRTLADDPDGFSLTRLASAELHTRINDLRRIIDIVRGRIPGRGTLTCDNPVDWDDTPTFYQACTIAHGHILHFKQQWIADGYSLGDLLYSLPLAPCQKKQIAIIDWDRREAAARRESLEEQEFLSAQLSRDRDISEIANGMVRESMTGGSSADTSSAAFGFGLGFIGSGVAGLLGVGGGSSSAGSTAFQNSSRETSASSLQSLRDRVSQSASALRSQRSTVIQTVSQSEGVRVETDVVANHNHCHAMTMEYFEVLRHFLVRNRLADVQECLFVPLLMSRFDNSKALRWRAPLQRYLKNRALARGFDALQRIADNYVGSDMPVGAYAEEELEYLDGFLRIRFQIVRPRDNDDDTFNTAAWDGISFLLGITGKEFWENFLRGQQRKDQIFAEMLGPKIAEKIVNGLRIFASTQNGDVELPVDPTLISAFRNDQALYVSIRLSAPLPPIRRDAIQFIKIPNTIRTSSGDRNIDTVLPSGSRIIVESGQMGYRTAHLHHDLFNYSRIQNDLSGTDEVLIFTPLDRLEKRRPRQEDLEYAKNLLRHLNDYLEFYHRALWWSMDAQRRYMLLDGFIAPNSGGRSVASVVENRLIGIIGNCLVMPVAPGFHLDPTYSEDPEAASDLLAHYQPQSPVPALRVAVPTKGVFAEAVMGACNSCEKIDESRFWRWEESPCPDEPTAIQPPSTESRRAEPPNLTAKDFPQPIVAFQNVPAAPDPAGIAPLLQLLGKGDTFRDITGLTENQKNALAGLQAAFNTATTFGTKAADLVLASQMNKDIDKSLDKIQEMKQKGLLTDDQAKKLTESALQGMIGGGAKPDAPPMSTKDVKELTDKAGENEAAVKVSRPTGEQVEVDARPKDESKEDSKKAIIILTEATEAAETRAFKPTTNDKSAVVRLEMQAKNVPSGGSFRWSSPDPGAITFDAKNSLRTKAFGIKPGLHDVDVEIRDSTPKEVASIKLKFAVPQFIRIDEDTVPFEKVLDDFGIKPVKEKILREAKAVCDHIYAKANVRTIWTMAPFNETVPAHIPVSELTVMTLKGDPPSNGLLGHTSAGTGGFGSNVPNETIEIFPGGIDDTTPGGDPTEMDVESLAIVLQIKSDPLANPALLDFAAKVFGRLIGETMAHEAGHSLIDEHMPQPSGHNSPAVANDLMNQGGDRSFTQRTGIVDKAHSRPVRVS